MHILVENGEKYFFDGTHYRKFASKNAEVKPHKTNNQNFIYSVKSQNVKFPSLHFELVNVENLVEIPTLDKNDCKKIVEFFAQNMSKIFDHVMAVSQELNQIETSTFSDGIDSTSGKSIIKVLAAQLLCSYLRKRGMKVLVNFEQPPERKGMYVKLNFLKGKDIYCEVVHENEINYQ